MIRVRNAQWGLFPNPKWRRNACSVHQGTISLLRVRRVVKIVKRAFINQSMELRVALSVRSVLMGEGLLCLKWRTANRAKKVPLAFPQLLEKSVENVLLVHGATLKVVLVRMDALRAPQAHSLLVAGHALSAFPVLMQTRKVAKCAKCVPQAL